jgi:hypothetical protein
LEKRASEVRERSKEGKIGEWESRFKDAFGLGA